MYGLLHYTWKDKGLAADVHNRAALDEGEDYETGQEVLDNTKRGVVDGIGLNNNGQIIIN